MELNHLIQAHPFPDPCLADTDGLVAWGGEFSPSLLLAAYAQGLFPWQSYQGRPTWWSPDPRWVLQPSQVRVSKSMAVLLRRGAFRVCCDTAFSQVIQACANTLRHHEQGTWITPEYIKAYQQLHHLGVAHSWEAWLDNQLVGGLYGLALGRVFFGESMFFRQSNASKYAFIHMARHLAAHHFVYIDCQVYTPHLASLGAQPIPRKQFLTTLRNIIHQPTDLHTWQYFS